MIKAMANYFVAVNPSSISHIYFALADMEAIGAYTLELARLDAWEQSEKIERKSVYNHIKQARKIRKTYVLLMHIAQASVLCTLILLEQELSHHLIWHSKIVFIFI